MVKLDDRPAADWTLRLQLRFRFPKSPDRESGAENHP